MLDHIRPPRRRGPRHLEFSLSLPVFIFLLFISIPRSDAQIKVIYGTDDRHELFEELAPEIRQIADATLALIPHSELREIEGGVIRIRTENYGKKYHLCSAERFREQGTAAFCSGFLVTPDLVMTAGHCIRNLLDCQETAFVFGFAYSTPLEKPEHVPRKDVYYCRELLRSMIVSDGIDFALVRLDRPVTDRTPLRLRLSGEIKPGEDLIVLGHPAGLPLKIANGAHVREVHPNGYFTANLDTYGGNSGSPVVNIRTYEVEGILVRGERDYILTEENGKSCFASFRCTDAGCRGEAVTLISEVLKITGLGAD